MNCDINCAKRMRKADRAMRGSLEEAYFQQWTNIKNGDDNDNNMIL